MIRDFSTRYGPTALIIGASEGIGASFARELAAAGLNLVVVARRAEKLESFARGIAEEFGVSCTPVAADVGSPEGIAAVEQLASEQHRKAIGEIGLLVYNAAAAPRGYFLDADPKSFETAIAVNCLGATRLSYTFGRAMRYRGRGGIVLMSSLTGLAGSPYLAAYAATKAYLVRLGASLEVELAQTGVSVITTCAGATATPGFLDARPQGAGAGFMTMSPERVVRGTLGRLPRGGRYIPGLMNRLGIALLGVLPPRLSARVLGRATQKMLHP